MSAETTSPQIATPGQPAYDELRSAWNLAVDQRPDLVAAPADAAGVAAAVAEAGRAGLRVAMQGTGHSAAAYGSLEGAMLIRTGALDEISIDRDARRARVGAGVVWGPVVERAGRENLAALAGSAHDVGVVGYSLGGGVGWLARKYGLASDRVTAAEIVTADGELRRVDADHDPDLLWALRGGGGSFGAVTALEFELLPVHRLYAGALFFPFERAEEVLETWRGWTDTVPDEMTSLGRLMRIPPFDEIPEPLRGRSFAVIEAVYAGPEEPATELLEPLRALGAEIDTFAAQAPQGLLELHMDPPGPVPGMGDHQMLADLAAEPLAALVRAIGPGTDAPLVSFEIRHLGGALGRRCEDSGALGALDGRYMTYGVGMLPGPEAAPAVAAAQAAAREALDACDDGVRYLNFSERRAEPEALFGPRTLTRLREVKQRVDPGNLFRGNQPIDA
jgi:FAD/FMN-containing dehydrogenase